MSKSEMKRVTTLREHQRAAAKANVAKRGREYMAALGRKGAKARTKHTTHEMRVAWAKKAALTRWAKT